MHQRCDNLIHNAHPDIINRAFGHHPNMPPPNPKTWTFYGNMESYRSFVDTNQFCAAAPGVSSGLYNPQGPLTLSNARSTPIYLTDVKSTANFSLKVTFSYSNQEYNKTVDLEIGRVYALTYLEDGDIKRCVGKCTDIWKINSGDTSHYYKIKFDCSSNYSNQTVVIKNDQIRNLSIYTGYEDQSTTITNGIHRFGTTCGTIREAVITNATVDSANNVIEGDIVSGIIEGFTIDGIASGKNDKETEINTVNSMTKDGKIIEGKIISGLCISGNINGTEESDTHITSSATVKGTLTNVIILNSSVHGGTTTGGEILDTKMTGGILYDATITGEDMITRGGITVGNITTGGSTIGGDGIGGTAVGIINNKPYTIENGTTVAEEGKNLITTGGVVVGGTIIGGEQHGDTIVNAIVKGGVVTKGITVNGVTSVTEGANIIPTPATTLPHIHEQIHPDPDKLDLDENGRPLHIDKPSGIPGLGDYDLVVAFNENTGEVTSNLGRAVVQDIPHLIRRPIKNPYDGTNW